MIRPNDLVPILSEGVTNIKKCLVGLCIHPWGWVIQVVGLAKDEINVPIALGAFRDNGGVAVAD